MSIHIYHLRLLLILHVNFHHLLPLFTIPVLTSYFVGSLFDMNHLRFIRLLSPHLYFYQVFTQNLCVLIVFPCISLSLDSLLVSFQPQTSIFLLSTIPASLCTGNPLFPFMVLFSFVFLRGQQRKPSPKAENSRLRTYVKGGASLLLSVLGGPGPQIISSQEAPGTLPLRQGRNYFLPTGDTHTLWKGLCVLMSHMCRHSRRRPHIL